MRKLARLGWMVIALLIAGGVAMLAACQPSLGGINVVREAGLASTTTVEISERANKPGTDRLRQGAITDPATVQGLVKTLDQRLPLGPPAECLPQYRLRFQLADGRAEDFDYFCEDGASFLRGSQTFWKLQQIQPSAEFDELMQRAVAELE
ncbi:MAG: hypothetical protein AUK03_11000 [Anaerolineae bacterium CG2_30_64_16]|nr:MAG: hypothetical protein AUK03_11000 [Anaerolineae bacterium CG2_30_64_16]